MSKKFTCKRDLTSLLPNYNLDINHDANRNAIKEFVDRVHQGVVFGEVGNPVHRNHNEMMEVYNDNVCLRITDAKYDRKAKTLEMEVEPYGPAAHILDEIVGDEIELCARALLITHVMWDEIHKLITFDLAAHMPVAAS